MRSKFLKIGFPLSLLIFLSATVALAPLYSAAVTTRTTTVTKGGIGSFYIQGHSPVDLLVIGPLGVSPGNYYIGCNAEPCSGDIVQIAGHQIIAGQNLIDTFPVSADASFLPGPTGIGCDQELPVPETISIPNAPYGNYEVILLPSSTFFAPIGLGCLKHTTATTTMSSFGYTVDICNSLSDCNTSPTIQLTGNTGSSCPAVTTTTTVTTSSSCSITTEDITLGSNGVVVASLPTTGVPEFPFNTVVSLIAMTAVMLMVVKLMQFTRKDWNGSPLGPKSSQSRTGRPN